VEHLKELLAERDPDNRHRQALEPDRAPEHTRENFDRLADFQLAARDFELGPDEILWSVDRERDEFPMSSVAIVW
jgi:hypothetical protein